MSTDNKGSPIYLASKDGIFDKSSLEKTDPKKLFKTEAISRSSTVVVPSGLFNASCRLLNL